VAVMSRVKKAKGRGWAQINEERAKTNRSEKKENKKLPKKNIMRK